MEPVKAQDIFQSTHTAKEFDTKVNLDALSDLNPNLPIFSVGSKDGIPLYEYVQSKKPLPSFDKSDVKPFVFPFVNPNHKTFYYLQVHKDLANIKETEKITIKQDDSLNSIWIKERKFRLTASNVHKILHSSNYDALVQSLLNPTNISFLPPIIEGKNREPIVFNVLNHRFGNSNVRFRNTGLNIHPNFCFLGASPDGLIEKIDTSEYCLIEIKNKMNFFHKSLEELVKESDFCLEKCNTGYTLKKTHAFFHQIMCQMFCSNVHRCLFVLCYDMNQSLFYEEVVFDQQLWNPILEKLGFFYFHHYLPALIQSTLEN